MGVMNQRSCSVPMNYDFRFNPTVACFPILYHQSVIETLESFTKTKLLEINIE